MKKWIILELSETSLLDNMSIDLLLLEKYIKNSEYPILRFYNWKQNTLSIGRNQNIEEINIDFCKKNNIKIVRRPTGGKAVLHQGDLTYSIVASSKDGFYNNINESYLQVSQAIINGLNSEFKDLNLQIGNDSTKEYVNNSFCFDNSTITDINVNGKKIIGSAQLRKGNFFLQHGSIILNQDFELLKGIFNNKLKLSLTSFYLQLNYVPEYEIIKNCIIKGFKNYFKIEFIYKSFDKI
jgi:lipoate-protein ligase A